MADQGLKVHGSWRSPYSWRVEVALKLKGIAYEFVAEDLSNKSQELLKYNPVHKKVPVLVHNGKPIAESLVILEYIDETWPEHPLMPQDPHERAMARFWAKFIDDKCLPSLTAAAWGAPLEGQQKAFEEAHEYMSILEKEIEGKKFFGGEQIGLVDLVAAVIAFWVRAAEEAMGKVFLEQEKYPCLFQWAEEFISCSTIKESLPPRDRLVALYKQGVEAVKAA